MTMQMHPHHPFVLSASSGSLGTELGSEFEYRVRDSCHRGSGFSKMNEPNRPHENDVLMGRGGKNNQHSGNEQLRDMARLEGENYRRSTKKGKSYISRQLVQQMRSLHPPARFLKKHMQTGEWEDVGDDVAREKASQVLRDAVALLPETSEDVPAADPTDMPYPLAVASIPVSVDESERHQSVYPQRTPVLTHMPSDLPVATPLTSYRKRRRHPFYGYEGHVSREEHASPPSPTRRRYSSQHHHQQQQQHHYHHHPAYAYHANTIHSSPDRQPIYFPHAQQRPHPPVVNLLEPTLPRSHTENRRHRSQPNRPPTVSSRQLSSASAQSLLGDVHSEVPVPSGMNEFDLFNGELLASDEEEEEKEVVI